MSNQNEKNESDNLPKVETQPDGSVLSPSEFQIQREKTPKKIPSPEIMQEVGKLMAMITPGLNRLAILAKEYYIDLSFHAQNGVLISFRTSDLGVGGKGVVIHAIDHLLAAMDGYDHEELREAIQTMRDEIMKRA